MEVVMAAEISPEAIMAFAILKAKESNTPLLIEDVSKLFFEARQKGLEEVEKVALRRVPGGFYSEDVEAFFGRLLAADYARKRSPLEVQESGVELCRAILAKEMQGNPRALTKVAQALGFDASWANPALVLG